MCNYVVNLLYITIVYLRVYLVNVVNFHEMKYIVHVINPYELEIFQN